MPSCITLHLSCHPIPSPSVSRWWEVSVRLESPSTLLRCLRFLLMLSNLAQCQCQCQSFPPQKLGVVPVVVTSGERKGLGRSKYFAPCLWAISSTQVVLVKLKRKNQGTHWCRPPRSSLSTIRTCSATSTPSSRPG